MKTIADIKRRLVKGAKVHAVNHTAFDHRLPNGKIVCKDNDMGVREVSIVQSNSFAFKTVQSTGKVVDSWCDWPKKDTVKFIDADTFEIWQEADDRVFDGVVNGTHKVLTYKFV